MVKDVRCILQLVWWNDPTTKMSVLYKFFTYLFHHCQLLVITHPSWLLDHFTIQVVVSISHLSPFPTVLTKFTLNWSVVMCYDQQLTVVKQKCKEFVKVTIQWNCLGLFSRKFKVFILNFLFDVLFWFVGSSPSSSFFVVGRQEIVKQKSKNVQRKTIHETKNWK
jgi:hypothetical protein